MLPALYFWMSASCSFSGCYKLFITNIARVVKCGEFSGRMDIAALEESKEFVCTHCKVELEVCRWD